MLKKNNSTRIRVQTNDVLFCFIKNKHLSILQLKKHMLTFLPSPRLKINLKSCLQYYIRNQLKNYKTSSKRNYTRLDGPCSKKNIGI